MDSKIILEGNNLELTIHRLSLQMVEVHKSFSNTVIIGIQPRGIAFANKIVEHLTSHLGIKNINYGILDVSFYRDDVHKDPTIKSYTTDIKFSLENKMVILIDDVLYTGRTIRSAMDALLDFGRPSKIELAVLIDRKYSRHVPIQADYVGLAIDSLFNQKVKVLWAANETQTNQIHLINNIK
jgi:pyrimidine operon attenuation protein/uracil phosphoribosyltransferase